MFRKDFLLICSHLFVLFLVQTMLVVTIPLAATRLGASPVVLGALLSLPYVLPLLIAIPFGAWVTRHGSTLGLRLGATGFIAGTGCLLLLPDYYGLITGQMLIGLSQLMTVIAGQTAISNLGTGKTLERYFAWYATYCSIGQMIGPLIAGALIDHWGGPDTSFIAIFILTLAMAIAYKLPRDIPAGADQRTLDPKLLGYQAQLHLVKNNRHIQLSIMVSVAAMLTLGAHGSFLPVYLETLDFSATTIGFLISLRALSAVAIRPFTSQLVQLLRGRYRTMSLTIVFMAVGMIPLGFTESPWALAILTILVGIGTGISQPLSMVVLADAVSKAQKSSAIAVRLMANRSMQFMAPLLLGLLVEFSQFSIAYLIGGLVVLLHLLFFLHPPQESDPETAKDG